MHLLVYFFRVFFFFNDTATTEIYTLALHDALPIWPTSRSGAIRVRCGTQQRRNRLTRRRHRILVLIISEWPIDWDPSQRARRFPTQKRVASPRLYGQVIPGCRRCSRNGLQDSAAVRLKKSFSPLCDHWPGMRLNVRSASRERASCLACITTAVSFFSIVAILPERAGNFRRRWTSRSAKASHRCVNSLPFTVMRNSALSPSKKAIIAKRCTGIAWLMTSRRALAANGFLILARRGRNLRPWSDHLQIVELKA